MFLKTVVENFLRKKKAVNQCEACGHSSWSIPSASKGGDLTLSITCDLPITPVDGVYQVPPLAVPTTIVVCTHCGYIRFFASNLIKEEI